MWYILTVCILILISSLGSFLSGSHTWNIFEWACGIFILDHSTSTGQIPLQCLAFWVQTILPIISNFTRDSYTFPHTAQWTARTWIVTLFHHAKVTSLRSPTEDLLTVAKIDPVVGQFLCQTIKSYTWELVCQNYTSFKKVLHMVGTIFLSRFFQ